MTTRVSSMNRVASFLHARGWSRGPRNGLRHRLFQVAVVRGPWWWWGLRLTPLVGDDFAGTWDEPKMGTWWYHPGPVSRMRFTGWPRHARPVVVKDYAEFRELTSVLTEEQAQEWRAIGYDQDGELFLGRMFWGERFHGLRGFEERLLAKYLRASRRHTWWGLRTWLWGVALHASVHRLRPFGCNRTPEPGSGGYDHWHCQLRRHHAGFPHRYNGYTWVGAGRVIRDGES